MKKWASTLLMLEGMKERNIDHMVKLCQEIVFKISFKEQIYSKINQFSDLYLQSLKLSCFQNPENAINITT